MPAATWARAPSSAATTEAVRSIAPMRSHGTKRANHSGWVTATSAISSRKRASRTSAPS